MRLPEIVHRIDRLSALVVQRSSEPGSVALFRVEGAVISGPLPFLVQPRAEHAARSQSMEQRIAEALAPYLRAVSPVAGEASQRLARAHGR